MLQLVVVESFHVFPGNIGFVLLVSYKMLLEYGLEGQALLVCDRHDTQKCYAGKESIILLARKSKIEFPAYGKSLYY